MVTIRSAAPTDAHLLWDAERQTAMTPGLLAARPGEILVDAFKAKIEALTSRGRYAVAELEGARWIVRELLQAELRTLGIQMEIRSLIVARMFEMVRDYGKTKNPASAIDMITIFTPARIFDAHNYLDWHFNSKAWEYGRNFMYYDNPEVDRHLAQAAAALDDDKARPFYRQVSDLVMKDAPTIMIERLVGSWPFAAP
jgi:ABC-type oligopeptide transport system substrate-binding subunit